jgi:hypothetical protein
MRRGDPPDTRGQRRYRRAARRAFARVTFYREQCAAAGRLLDEPDPTAVTDLPDPPHTLCPFARPWSAEREPSLWTPSLVPLARALRTAGCRAAVPVLEVRDALLDYDRLPRRGPGRRQPYRVLLSAAAVVASPQRRTDLHQEALAVAETAGSGWVVGTPSEIADVTTVTAGTAGLLRPVYRVPVATIAAGVPADAPVVVCEPLLGYVGARHPDCGQFHLDSPRVFARERNGLLTLSFPRSRRPTLLDIVPTGGDSVTVSDCPRHGVPVLQPRIEDSGSR